MLPWVDVDSLQVTAWMIFARTPVLVAHLIVEGVHLLNSIFPHWILIFVVKSSAIQSILKIQTLLTLSEQLFVFFLALGQKQARTEFITHKLLNCKVKFNNLSFSSHLLLTIPVQEWWHLLNRKL